MAVRAQPLGLDHRAFDLKARALRRLTEHAARRICLGLSHLVALAADQEGWRMALARMGAGCRRISRMS